MASQDRYFSGPEYFEDLQRALPEDWKVEQRLSGNEDSVTFLFPFIPIENDESIDINLQATLHLLDFEDGDEFLYGTGPTRPDELPENIARHFEIDAYWPLPNDIINRLRSTSDLIIQLTMGSFSEPHS